MLRYGTHYTVGIHPPAESLESVTDSAADAREQQLSHSIPVAFCGFACAVDLARFPSWVVYGGLYFTLDEDQDEAPSSFTTNRTH